MTIKTSDIYEKIMNYFKLNCTKMIAKPTQDTFYFGFLMINY